VRQPIDGGRAAISRSCVDTLDQRAADEAATRRIVRNKQVKRAVIARHSGGSIVDRIHQPQWKSNIKIRFINGFDFD
jgi:hypothetical protein